MALQWKQFRIKFYIFAACFAATQGAGCGSSLSPPAKVFSVSQQAVSNYPNTLLDGLYAGVCESIDIDGDTVLDGARLVLTIEAGSTSIAKQVFDHDPICITATGFKSVVDGSDISGPAQSSTNLSSVVVDGIPSDFYLVSAVSIGALDVVYFLFYRDPVSGDLHSLENAIASDHGNQWSDWTDVTDIAGFASDPLLFSPAPGGAESGGDSINQHLVRVSAF